MEEIKKIFLVIPWYGIEAGGAEYLAHLFCKALVKLGVDVEVLTTCSKDVSSNWYKNYYKPGLEITDDIPVRRFPVREADPKRFHSINARLLNNLLVGPRDAEDFFQNSINSDELMQYIRDKGKEGVFIFIPYQYGTTVLGSRIMPERAFLIPCLHDEPIAYLSPVKGTFQCMRGILFSTPPEAELGRRIYGLDKNSIETFGVGIHEDFTTTADRFRQKFKIGSPYILFVGRKDPGKNVYYLIELFTKYAKEEKSNLHLILIGPEKISGVKKEVSGKIFDLGFIPEQDKRDAYSGAVALVQPSNRESFSIVIMEAWQAETPVLVNAHCEVTRWLVNQANGGLYFANYYEFKEALNLLLKNEDLRTQLGKQGKQFITQNYRWEDIVSRALLYIKSRLTPTKALSNK